MASLALECPLHKFSMLLATMSSILQHTYRPVHVYTCSQMLIASLLSLQENRCWTGLWKWCKNPNIWCPWRKRSNTRICKYHYATQSLTHFPLYIFSFVGNVPHQKLDKVEKLKYAEKSKRNNFYRFNQNGFRQGRGMVDQILAFCHLLEGVNSQKFPAIVTFVDFRKAFDSIHRVKMCKILFSYGIPEKIVAAISNMYDTIRTKVISPDN